MNFNNFTIKAQEAVQQAVQLVTQNNQQAIEGVHLLKAVIMTGESITNFVFQKLGMNPQNIVRVVDAQIASLPKVSGGEPYLSNEANAILQKAMSPALLTNASELITSVSDCVETNMTRTEMAKFINMQLSQGASWSIESVAATGTGDSQACYSSGSQLLYVMWPDEAAVADISEKMQQVLNRQ